MRRRLPSPGDDQVARVASLADAILVPVAELAASYYLQAERMHGLAASYGDGGVRLGDRGGVVIVMLLGVNYN